MAQSSLAGLLAELVAISPMPSDEKLLQDRSPLVDRYDDLIKDLSRSVANEQPDAAEEAELVRIVANSFGIGEGMEVYWGALHLIERCTPAVALPVIRERASNGPPGCRRWCCFLLGRQRNIEDLELFLALLQDDVADVQVQALHSLVMLSQEVPLQNVAPTIRTLVDHDNPLVRKAAQRALDKIGA